MIYELVEKVEKEVSNICNDYEIFLSQSKSIEVNSKKTQLDFAKEEIDLGLGIRVLKNNKMGFAFTSDIEKIKETANQALENTKLNEADKNFSFSNPKKVKEVKDTYDSKFDELTIEESIELLENLLTTANETKCDITSAGFSASKQESIILNSNGVSISNKGTGFGIGLSVNLEENGNVATAYDSQSSRFFDIDEDKLAKEVCQLAIDSANPKPIETNDYDVVLDYHAATGLLSTFISAFSAENVQRERSILKNKIGEEIVSPNLSITDDATLPKALGSTNCDGEGTVTQKTELVENGILKSFLYDIYTANKGNCESTGNGFRGSFSSTPGVSPSNILFDFKDELEINDIQNGVLTTSVLGAHTANPISGDFSVEASNGFKIENGEITEPINKAMISGNIFELLKDCEAIKSEHKQYGSFIIPKILVHNLRVVGQ